MLKKQMKKKPQRKKKKTPAKKPSKKKPAAKKPVNKLKKSIARKAVRKAVAKRAKKASKKGVKSMKKKPSKKPSKKTTAKKTLKKKAPKKRTTAKAASSKKKATKKTVRKSIKSKAGKPAKPKPQKKKATSRAPGKKTPALKKPLKNKPTTPKLREKKKPAPPPHRELDRAEISRLLSDAYARHLVIEAGGEHALEIVRGFSNNSSDEDISKKLKIKISDVRATLNKLHSLGIVDYTRHKDSETGWFSYFWCLNVHRMKSWVNSRIEDERRNFDFSKGEYYFCPNCGGASIHEFVSAADFGFKCPVCSSALDFLSDAKAEELFPMKAFRKPHL
jgi:transcription factor E